MLLLLVPFCFVDDVLERFARDEELCVGFDELIAALVEVIRVSDRNVGCDYDVFEIP